MAEPDYDDLLEAARLAAEAQLYAGAGDALDAYLNELAVTAGTGQPVYPTPAQWAAFARNALYDALFSAYLGVWEAGEAFLDALGLPDDDIAAVLAAWLATREQAAQQFAAEALERLAGVPGQIESQVGAAIFAAAREGRDVGEAAREAVAAARPDTATGDWRASRIAQTEATAAAGAAVQAQGEAAQRALAERGSRASLSKKWVTERDERVRHAHATTHGQVVALTGSFDVGGFSMRFPGDPSAPPDLVINCRCHLKLVTERRSQAGLTAGGTMSYKPTVSMRTDTPGATAALDGLRALASANARVAQSQGAASRTASGAGEALPDGWRGVLAPLDTLSGDGRMLKSAAGLRARPYPLPFLAQEALSMGHDGAVNIGRTDRVWVENGNLMGEGPFDLADAEGAAWARRIADGFAGGVSVDLDDVIVSEHFFDRDTGEEMDPDEAMEILWFSDDPAKVEYQMHMDDWRLIGHTAVYQPAFYQAQIQPVYGYELTGEVEELPAERDAPAKIAAATAAKQAAGAAASMSLLAAGVPVGPTEPPAAWFDAPTLPGPTPITVDDDGRVYGHIALWSSCHTGSPDICIAPPRTTNSYALFHTGEIVVREGHRLSVGRMTVGEAGHADPFATVAGAIEHYDNTGSVVAIVRATEDAHGIVVAGALHPSATKQQVADFLLSPPSGDWRRVGTNLELVAVLSVNTPGYPVTRPRAAASADRQVSLVASGVPPVHRYGSPVKLGAHRGGPVAQEHLSATLARSLRRGRIEQIQAGLVARSARDPWQITRETIEKLEVAGQNVELVRAAAARHGFRV